jgi:hypothetical protein
MNKYTNSETYRNHMKDISSVFSKHVRQLDVGYHVVMTAAIPDAMLLPTDECFAQEVPEHAYDGLTCLK